MSRRCVVDGPNPYWHTVDALGLSRIEVARGPFSMLYGSDAIGGTVNAITRGVQDLRPGSTWDRRLYYRYGSAENLHIARVESVRLGGRYEYAQADADSVEDPLTGDAMSVSGDWDDMVGSARLLYYLDDHELWNVFAGILQGFRAPNLSDLTRFDSARTDEVETPSPEQLLAPVTLEIPVSFQLAPGPGAESPRR